MKQPRVSLSDLRDLARPNSDWAYSATLLGATFCLLVYYVTILLDVLWSFNGGLGRNDFDCLYASEYAWSHHLNPYLIYPLSSRAWLGVRGIFLSSPNLNPPVSLYLFQELASVELVASAHLWALLSICLFGISVILVVRANPNPALRSRILLILGMAGVWATFFQGQVYMILLLLAVAAWLFFNKKKPTAAGIAIGILCALKPNFLVWPTLLILARHRKAGISAILTFAIASIFPFAFGGGLQIYRQWLAACRYFKGYELLGNSSITAVFMRLDPYLGTTHYFKELGLAVTIALLLAIAWLMWRRAPGVFRTSEIALVVALLAGPISWPGYTLLLIPALYGRRLSAPIRVGWVLLCTPLSAVLMIGRSRPLYFVLFGSPYFYGIALVGSAFIYELYRERALAPEVYRLPPGAESFLSKGGSW